MPFFFLTLLLNLLLIGAAATHLPAASRISDYQPVFIPFCDEDGTLLAAVRKYNRADHRHYLVLDPQRFTLSEMTVEKVISSRPVGFEEWRETPFSLALTRQTSPPYLLQNDGLREAEHPVPGFFLTADLCPSKKPLDRVFIETTMALPQKAPVPLALMISGLWIQRHEADLTWLKDQVAAGKLAITWVNHSFNHPYEPAAPLEKNFLLIRKTDFTNEVLFLERLLLEQGLIPSPFFRFPGLVSDRQLIESLRDLCLIPVGSSAWLAKGESPQAGSIILVHANGNEPEGIRLLLSFYGRQREAFRQGSTALLPLREALLLR
ncbi:MAG: hypothetical protein Q8K00_19740 [Syntrophales bacterium]|nr:hypothetical protein [Syntrophales bacterium]